MSIRRGMMFCAALLGTLFGSAQLNAQTPQDAGALSLDSLLNIRVSTASRYEQIAAAAPASVVIVTGEEIRKFGYRTLADVLNNVAGFYVSYDRNYTYIGVRGFSRPTDYNNRILLLLNGQRMNEGFYGSAYYEGVLGIDMRNIERVEIVRGPGSALYGTSAMFAVVNLVTASSNSGPAKRVTAGFGDAGLRQLSAAATGNAAAFEYNVGAQYSEQDGKDQYYAEYDTPATNHGTAEGLDWERARSLFARVKFRPLEIQAHMSGRQKGVPTASWQSAFNDPRERTNDELSSIEAHLNFAVAADKQLDVRARYDRYVYGGWYPAEDSKMFYDKNDVRSTGLDASMTWDVSPKHRLIAGMEANWYMKAFYKAWSAETVDYDDDTPYSSVSGFVQSEFHLLPNLALYAGTRLDRYSTGHHTLSPRAALVWAVNSNDNIKLLTGRAYREPNVYERDFHTHYQKKAPVLAERVVTTELDVQHRLTPQAVASFSAFFSDIDNLIDTTLDPADSMIFFANTSAARSYGGEVELLWRHSIGEIKGSYAYAYADNERTDVWLSNSPQHLLKATATANINRTSSLALSARYESGRRTLQGTVTGNSLTSDVVLHLLPGNHIDAMMMVRNIFDAKLFTPGGLEHKQAAILQDGRNFGVQVEWHI